jgi:hypothetical protein
LPPSRPAGLRQRAIATEISSTACCR